MTMGILSLGSLAVHYTVREVRNPDNFAVSIPTKNPELYRGLYRNGPIPMHRFTGRHCTFRELW